MRSGHAEGGSTEQSEKGPPRVETLPPASGKPTAAANTTPADLPCTPRRAGCSARSRCWRWASRSARSSAPRRRSCRPPSWRWGTCARTAPPR
ncbi:PP284 [Orf virus]|uniref:PP284 n=1 Tax=Orf virus TaxID=10258 RepID=F1AXJ4_ORFV|nr:PP284 [Orf virus]